MSETTYQVYAWRHAPGHLLTRRQLRARGLRRAGQDPVAEVRWYRGLKVAYLYDVNRALPVRPMTPGRARALAAAMRARRTCPKCGIDRGYCIPRSYGACWPCVGGDDHDQEHDYVGWETPRDVSLREAAWSANSTTDPHRRTA
ncbi:RRQRL motif-containing zinc-binding protein [Embleya sp. NPDC059237]|uniref:RRQRL motif-containing zinc-binding protein n=1 Tax=Embleya sp. NPDC059237 TaxID=3346784 RepID=UPI0036897F37